MNILYISSLNGKRWTGLYYSVPNQIKAQSEYDNVFWYNINGDYESNSKSVKCYSIKDYPSMKIKDLPQPFNMPDLVVFESLYFFSYCRIAKECRKKNIPYIIIPRSSLTDYAQSSKKMKKKLGNFLFFNRFINNAAGIQYLTEQEYKDSGNRWNDQHIIIPNGIKQKGRTKNSFNKNILKGVFIGRLDIYQKGLDLLLEACLILKKELEYSKCTIDIYGPNKENSKERLIKKIRNNKLNKIITIRDSVFADEKERVLLRNDFFVLTSRFEGHPMGLIEALSYGLPCLVTSGTNMAEEIRKKDAGWIADISSEGIAEALESLLKEKRFFQEKSYNALNLSKRYNWDELAKITHNKYLKII